MNPTRFVTFEIFFYMTRLYCAEKLKYLDNFGDDGTLLLGRTENPLIGYATLASEPEEELANEFTVCSSIYSKFRTSATSFFQLYQEDGKTWFNFMMSQGYDTNDFTEHFFMIEKRFYYLGHTKISVVPHSWYRACLGLNTVTGKTRYLYRDISCTTKK